MAMETKMHESGQDPFVGWWFAFGMAATLTTRQIRLWHVSLCGNIAMSRIPAHNNNTDRATTITSREAKPCRHMCACRSTMKRQRKQTNICHPESYQPCRTTKCFVVLTTTIADRTCVLVVMFVYCEPKVNQIQCRRCWCGHAKDLRRCLSCVHLLHLFLCYLLLPLVESILIIFIYMRISRFVFFPFILLGKSLVVRRHFWFCGRCRWLATCRHIDMMAPQSIEFENDLWENYKRQCGTWDAAVLVRAMGFVILSLALASASTRNACNIHGQINYFHCHRLSIWVGMAAREQVVFDLLLSRTYCGSKM